MIHSGRAHVDRCTVSRAVIACSINSNEASELTSTIRAIKDKVERLAI